MKYKIHYSIPYDIHRYKMIAKNEDQLITFLKMLRDEQAYGFEVVQSTQQRGIKMGNKKFLITWKTKIDDNYIDERQIVCNYERSAHFLYDEIAKKDKTVDIKMEQLTNE